jgi:hypothetical protein
MQTDKEVLDYLGNELGRDFNSEYKAIYKMFMNPPDTITFDNNGKITKYVQTN